MHGVAATQNAVGGAGRLHHHRRAPPPPAGRSSAHLVRTSLVCKQWRRVLSDPDFLRLYARIHRTPPLLGFFTLGSSQPHPGRRIPCFVPTTTAAAGARGPLAIDHCPWLVLDCRHGRVLLQRRYVADDARDILVWDPVTGDRHELPWPNKPSASRRSVGVVLCAAAADGCDCDHSGCRGGPFLVLCADVGLHSCPTDWRARARVYSSRLGAWGAPAHLDLRGYEHFEQSRAVVVGDQVYLFRFFLGGDHQILRYDLRRHGLSAIDSPGFSSRDTDVEHMTTEEGLLGLAGARRSRLHPWSRTADDAGWEQSRVIDLRMMIPSPAAGGAGDDDNSSVIESANVIGFAEGANAMLVGTNAGTFVLDLKSERARKVCDTRIHNHVVPFMTFYSPGCACGKSPLPVETLQG